MPPETAPVQQVGQVPWAIHLAAWRAYARIYGTSQSAERIAERGGFGREEMDQFAPDGWSASVVKQERSNEPAPCMACRKYCLGRCLK